MRLAALYIKSVNSAWPTPVFIVFSALKLLGVIDWSWLAVSSPMIIHAVLFSLVVYRGNYKS